MLTVAEADVDVARWLPSGTGGFRVVSFEHAVDTIAVTMNAGRSLFIIAV